MNLQEFQEVVKEAIQAEINAANFYRSLQDQVKSDTSKVILKELENMEWGHKHILEHLDTEGIEQYESAKIPDLKISETMIVPPETSHMSIQEIIITAMKREEAARDRYGNLAMETDDIRIKNLLLRLSDEEAKHKLQLETIYDTEILYEN
jgi:rubrerythrin